MDNVTALSERDLSTTSDTELRTDLPMSVMLR